MPLRNSQQVELCSLGGGHTWKKWETRVGKKTK